MKLNLLEILERYDARGLFGEALKQEKWIWINEEIIKDLFLDILDYDSYDEDQLTEALQLIKEKALVITQRKLKEAGWIMVTQRVFQELEEDFNGTEDIETYIFLERKYYMTVMISKMREFEWMLKAMAIDTYQHLNPEGISLKKIYQEDFQENYMILERFLGKEDYERGIGRWRLELSNKTLFFFKNSKEHRQWAETHANFIFEELNK